MKINVRIEHFGGYKFNLINAVIGTAESFTYKFYFLYLEVAGTLQRGTCAKKLRMLKILTF
jgi:hypothetical protein